MFSKMSEMAEKFDLVFQVVFKSGFVFLKRDFEIEFVTRV